MDTSVFALHTRPTPDGWTWLLSDDAHRRVWLQRMLLAYALLLGLHGLRAIGLWGQGLHMDALGSRSLGELLFCDRAFTRQAIEVCHYPRAWLPTADQADNLWARRSRFDRGTLSVLVAEVFLPSFWHALHDHPENC